MQEFAAVAASLQQENYFLEQEAQQILQNVLQNECVTKDFLIAEFKENILAQGKAIAELKANSVAQEFGLGECRKEIAALRAERGTLKAQTASLNGRVAEFHDEVKELRRDLMAARSDVQRGNGEMAVIKAEHFD